MVATARRNRNEYHREYMRAKRANLQRRQGPQLRTPSEVRNLHVTTERDPDKPWRWRQMGMWPERSGAQPESLAETLKRVHR